MTQYALISLVSRFFCIMQVTLTQALKTLSITDNISLAMIYIKTYSLDNCQFKQEMSVIKAY